MQVLKVRAGFDSTPGHQYLVPFDPIRVSHLKLFGLRQSTLRIRGANNHLVVKLPTARLFPGRCLFGHRGWSPGCPLAVFCEMSISASFF